MSDLPEASSFSHRGRTIKIGLRRFVHGLRTEGGSPRQEVAAIAAGVFIGCLPFYGLHLAICWGVGWLLGLNRVKMYLAAHVSNPFVAPWLLFAELQAGSWLRRGTFHAVTVESLSSAGVAVLTADLLIGSVAIGGVLAALAAWGTHMTTRGSAGDQPFVDLVRAAADRYAAVGITAWEFARGKLKNDPVYRAMLERELLTGDWPAAAREPRTLLDIGCGQGLTLAILAEARRRVRAGEWALPFEPPVFDRMVGVETRPRIAAMAHAALAGDAEIVSGDARATAFPRSHCVLLFDVLHLMPAADQERLLASIASSLQPGGTIVVREADRSAGWRFQVVQIANRLKAVILGPRRQPFHFRSTAEWAACFARLGLHSDVRPMGKGTPFGNVLFRVTSLADTSGAGDRSGPPQE